MSGKTVRMIGQHLARIHYNAGPSPFRTRYSKAVAEVQGRILRYTSSGCPTVAEAYQIGIFWGTALPDVME